MKAVRILEPENVEVCDIQEPQMGDEDVLVKVRGLGLCGTDLKTYIGQNPLVRYPRILGHEIAGEVVDVGSGVPQGLEIGTPVTVIPYTSCGTCASCLAGRVNCCKNNQTMGVQRDGAAAELITVHHSKVLACSTLDYEQIALVEPLSIGWHATTRAALNLQDTVLVFGCGVIGLGVIVAASFKGARVIAVDIDDGKLERARELGAVSTINSKEEELGKKVSEITHGHGPGVVVEAVGLTSTFRAAVDLVSFAGRVVYIGLTKSPVEYTPSTFILKELDVRGSRNALKEDFQAVIEMLASGRVDVKALITHRYELVHTGEALRFWNTNPLQVTKILALSD
jgi:2-desacetyl-2-hydroxyethyl bacteriochlorophyllide A dehydrogenase